MKTMQEFDMPIKHTSPGTVRKLTLTGDSWHFENVDAPDFSFDGIQIGIESVVVPPGMTDAGFWAGHDLTSTTSRYAGWGTFIDHSIYQKSDLLPISQETSVSASLKIVVCATIGALNSCGQVKNTGVIGEGLLTSIISKYLGNTVIIQSPSEGAKLDLLIDTTGESSSWNDYLPSLRNEGTLLLLIPPWSRPASFNFYPQLHRRSFRVIAKQWHMPRYALDNSLQTTAKPIISAIEQEKQYIRPLIHDGNNREAGVWHWIDWK